MSEPSAGHQSDPQRRGLLAIVGLLVALLVVGGVFVVKALVAPPSNADASTKAAAANRDNAKAIEAGLEAAASYQRERKYTEAAAILEKLSEQSPTDRAVRVAYAQSLIGLEKHALAYKQYEAAIALGDSGDAVASGDSQQNKLEHRANTMKRLAGRRDPTLAALHFEAGTCANEAGITDRAEEHYWMAQVLDSGEARYPLYLAMIHIRKGDDEAAMAALVRAVNLNPDLAEAWGTMAEIELKKNQTSLAAQHIETARKLQPDVTRWMLVQARAFNRQGDADKAAAMLETVSATQRDKAMLTTLAQSYGMLQQPRKAAEMYEAAVKNAPTDAELIRETAQWWHRAGDAVKALSFAKTAAMLGDDDAKSLVQTLTGNHD